MKKLFVALLAMLLLVGCGSDPKGMVEAYYGYLDKGEVTEAYQLMSKQFTAQVGEQKIRAIVQKQAKEMQAKGGIISLTLEGEAKGEIGGYKVHLVFKDGTKIDDKVSVVKEDGGWKISPK